MQAQELYTKIFNTKSDTPSDTARLTSVLEQHPYFSVAHFFTLYFANNQQKKYPEIAAKASLHFNHPLLLESRLKKTTNKEIAFAQHAFIKEEVQEQLFEPLHTTDYFASQGIKISEEVKPTDALGKQLKSFTEWLKTMKKVNFEEMASNNVIHDSKIQQMAEISNIESDVITESMADVFVQQGKKSKAIDIYQKLSLQFPSKSRFFADKIESLKDK
jgi:hypothetical protein